MSNTTITLPIDHERGFRKFSINEIYSYRYFDDPAQPVVNNAVKTYVPNVDDEVIDWNRGNYRVTHVDYTTGVATLKFWVEPVSANDPTDVDLLLGSAPSHPSELFRLYTNNTVTPFTLSIDSSYSLYGEDIQYVKFYRGTNVGQNAESIGVFYDGSGNLLGDQIPLELVGYRPNNTAIKRPKSAHTHQRLNDGEVVTMVGYGDNNIELSFATLLVHNTSFVRSGSSEEKYITAISVESPFLSPSDPTLLEYPINMPVENLNLMGVVHYSDGSKMRRPVDGTKFSMHGLSEYIATIQEQRVPLVLQYRLAENEHSYILTPSPNRTIAVRMSAQTMRVSAAYSVKLFAYPVWRDAVSGYSLEFFLANLERGEIFPVTNLVQLQTGSREFDPLLYGSLQRIGFALDLNRVDSRFKQYRHVQSLQISLLAPANDISRTPWVVNFNPNGEVTYGDDLYAEARFVNTNNWRLNLASGIESRAQWLQRVYYDTFPLYDSETEERAPEPNFFKLVVGSHEIEVPIDMWNADITSHVAPGIGQNVYLQFFRRNPTTDLYLGVSALSTRHL